MFGVPTRYLLVQNDLRAVWDEIKLPVLPAIK